MNSLRWCWHKARGLHARIMLNCLVGIVRVAASLSFVWTSKMLVDAATSRAADTRTIVTLSVTLIALMLAEMCLSLWAQYISNRNEVMLKTSLRSGIYDHLMHSCWHRQHHLHSGDLLNRLTEDVRVIPDVVCVKLPDVVIMTCQLCGAFAMLYYMSWKLALCVLAIMPVFLLLSKIYIRKTRAVTAGIRRTDSDIQTDMQEGIQHHDVVQTFESENRMSRRLSGLHDTLYDMTMRRTRIGVVARGLVRTGFIICFLTAFIWSVWHLHTGAITFGTMTAFLQLVARIQNPMANLANLVPSFVHALASVDRLVELEELPVEDKQARIWLEAPVGVRIEHLGFRYTDGGREIFHDFSYDFAPGSRTVIMGETGIGKSTLIRLLLALLRPDSGSISLYDTHRSVAVSAATRCNMVYVPQGNSLLSGTIRRNLLLADPDATDDMLRRALHTAAADFVYDLPSGIDTVCGELGSGLSEGQAQRIAIARALLRKGSILLLDEFNSALDRDTAATLMERLAAASSGHTIIYISHRPDIDALGADVLRF